MRKIYKILVVEDDAPTAAIITESLERYNFQVTNAINGRESFLTVRKNKYDLILCDIMMPVMDGMEFLEKSSNFIEGTPVIMLTAFADKDYITRASRYKVASYLLKPIKPEALLDRIKKTINISDIDMIDKKMIPAGVKITRNNLPSIEITIVGCPDQNFPKEFLQKITPLLEEANSNVKVRIEIQEEFGYYTSCFKLLDEIVLEIKKKFKLKPTSVIFSGDLFEILTLTDLETNPNLKECTIENLVVSK